MSGANSALPTTEQELIARIRSGEEWAFDLMMKEYQTPLYQYANRFVHSPDLAADVVQDVFISFWDRRATVHITGSLRGYLFGAIRNAAVTLLHSEHARGHREETSLRLSGASAHSAAESVEWNEFALAIRRAIDELPERGREIFLLVRENDLSYSEVATALGVSVSTVKTQMSRSVNTLATKLAHFF